MHLCGHREKEETVIGTVSDRVFDVYTTKVMECMNHVCEDLVIAWKTT